jgi:hypothetical protein
MSKLAKEETTKKHSNRIRKLENPTTIYRLWWQCRDTQYYVNSYFKKEKAEKDKKILEKIFRDGFFLVETYPNSHYY